jgi:hypothetical protein
MRALPGAGRVRTAAMTASVVLLATGLTSLATATGATAAARAVPSGTAKARAVQATAIDPDVIVHPDTARRAGLQPAAAPPAGYSPSNLRSAYNLASAATSGGKGATVAIIGVDDDPAAASDLAVYRTQYGLPACTTASGCLSKVNENGAVSPLPPAAPAPGSFYDPDGFAGPVDADMVSAICPNCRILLVEAQSPYVFDMGTAVDSAVALGAKFVIVDWDDGGNISIAADEKYFDHPGVAIVAPAGDQGYGNDLPSGSYYPADSEFVTAVGGTTLTKASNARGWAETVWGPPTIENGLYSTGSQCSPYYGKPSWQTDTGCAGRTANDVAAVADPGTPVAFYDTDAGAGGWQQGGGTTVAASIVGAVYALAGPPAPDSYPVSYPYHDTAGLYPVTSGSNALSGDCPASAAYLCTAGPGYNGPAGWGTPDGTGAFTLGGADEVALISPGEQYAGVLPEAVSIQLRAQDSAANPLTFTATGLPPGVTLDPATGLISGTVTADYSGTVTVSASDSAGASASVSFAWSAENDLEVFSPGIQQTEPSTAVSLKVPFREPDKSATDTFSATGLPPGLTLNPGTGVISGTTSATIASYTVTVTGQDSDGSASTITFSWRVWNLVTITIPNQQQLTVGIPFKTTVSATDSAPGSTFTYSASSLPPGITINPATGVISGTPTALWDSDLTASAPFQITATDEAGSQGFAYSNWYVGGVITFRTVPAQVSVADRGVNLAFTVSDNAKGDSLSYNAQGLPPGVGFIQGSYTSTGNATATVLAGWPSTPGTYHVTLTADGFYFGSGSTTFTWTVKPATITPPTGPVVLGGGHDKCLDDTGNSAASGTKIEVRTCDGSAEQRWQYDSDGTLRIHGKCLDTYADQVIAGTPIVLASCTGTQQQTEMEHWVELSLNSTILNSTGFFYTCLADPDPTAAKNGVQVEASGTCGTAASTWTLPAGPVLSGVPGMCLDDYRDSTANGARVDLYPCNGTKAQAWTIDPNETLQIGGKCLTLPSASGSAGAAGKTPVLEKCTGSTAQRWYIAEEWAGDTYAHPLGEDLLGTNLCLAPPASLTAKPTWLVMAATCTEPAGLWQVW